MHLDVRPPVRLSIVRPATNWPLLQSATVTSFRPSPLSFEFPLPSRQLANRDPSLYRMTATHVAPTRKPITVGGSKAVVGEGDVLTDDSVDSTSSIPFCILMRRRNKLPMRIEKGGEWSLF